MLGDFDLSRDTALHKKSVGAVSDRDRRLPYLPTCEVALNRRRRRPPHNEFLCKARETLPEADEPSLE
jgi:hypothetical protein